jgi:hypothetical protein
MIPHAWIEKQVFSMPIAELKTALGRQRLRVSRQQILNYLLGLLEQQSQMRHYKHIHGKAPCAVGYSGYMYGLGLVAPLWQHLVARYRAQTGIVFDGKTIADSSLMPSKEEASITQKDWDRGVVTVRGKGKAKYYICGEKLLTLTNSLGQIVISGLLPSINSSDANVFKQPMAWASRGLRHGNLLIDKGLANNAVQSAIAFLRRTLPKYTLRAVSPPRSKKAPALSPADQLLYRERWEIEEVFRQLKDFMGSFRLSMRGCRRACLREARVAIATLAWNWRLANA